MSFDLDLGVEHCPCGRLTGNPWGLCTPCTDAEYDDPDYSRPLRVIDPNGARL